jgi:uncharacterized PurR-regulated membrane protein YhhQ (DUF165 family)
VLTGGAITFPFVAQLIDMINEIYGKRMAYIATYHTLAREHLYCFAQWRF